MVIRTGFGGWTLPRFAEPRSGDCRLRTGTTRGPNFTPFDMPAK